MHNFCDHLWEEVSCWLRWASALFANRHLKKSVIGYSVSQNVWIVLLKLQLIRTQTRILWCISGKCMLIDNNNVWGCTTWVSSCLTMLTCFSWWWRKWWNKPVTANPVTYQYCYPLSLKTNQLSYQTMVLSASYHTYELLSDLFSSIYLLQIETVATGGK